MIGASAPAFSITGKLDLLKLHLRLFTGMLLFVFEIEKTGSFDSACRGVCDTFFTNAALTYAVLRSII